MAVISFKCPNCDGELIYDPQEKNYKCEYCNSTFSQEELDGLKPDTCEEQKEDDVTEVQKEAEDAVFYSCPSCGAEIVTDKTTAATFCYYCHNPVILGGRLEGDYLPDKIIPFEITKEAAINRFLEYVGRKKFVPKAFFSKQQIETISGVYFPYWSYQAEVENAMQGEAKILHSWTTGDMRYTETKVYHVRREGVVSLTNLTENALQKANADLAKGIMPYDFDKMQDFKMGYLSGFFAQKRDIEKASLTDKMQNEAKQYTDKLMRGTISGYNSTNVTSTRQAFLSEKWSYCLLPIWTITYKGGDGKIYYYSMNGQTGEICGQLPVDKKKLGMVSIAVSLAIFILGLIGGYIV